jgi:glycerol uptake facilitator-like aquaporin
MILFFEFLGTAMVTCLWNNSMYTPFPVFISFFIVLIMGANISGSHYNPAVTLAFMFRKDNGRFRRLLGLLYMVAQFGGGIFGAVISYTMF